MAAGTGRIAVVDLATRKLPLSGGATVRGYLDELRETVSGVMTANDPTFGSTGPRLAEAVESLERATHWMIGELEARPNAVLASATPYLRLFAPAAGG